MKDGSEGQLLLLNLIRKTLKLSQCGECWRESKLLHEDLLRSRSAVVCNKLEKYAVLKAGVMCLIPCQGYSSHLHHYL